MTNDEHQCYDTAFTIVHLGRLTREEITKDSRSTTQVTEQSVISQNMDECPKARKDNELGLEMTLFKSCVAWPKQRHVSMQIFSHGGYFSIVIDEQITGKQYCQSFDCLKGYIIVPAEVNLSLEQNNKNFVNT